MLLPAHDGLIDFFSMGTEKEFEAGRAQAELSSCLYEAETAGVSASRLGGILPVPIVSSGARVSHRLEVHAAPAAKRTDMKNPHSVQTQHICLGQDAPIVPGTFV
jgi:hypothetical protein